MIKNIGIPKYLQLVSMLQQSIATNTKNYGEKLPSITKTCRQHKVSRDTVLLAYETLKKRGIVYSIIGKGYFVKSFQVETQKRIFILFDELNAFKEELYLSLIKNLGKHVVVDVFFHHFNPNVFKSLIEEADGHYNNYVIMPSNLKNAPGVIALLKMDDVYLLDQTRPLWKKYASVFQDFEKDIYDCLCKVENLICYYTRMYLIFPGDKEPIGMVKGFLSFAKKIDIVFAVSPKFIEDLLQPSTLFVVVNDNDLVQIIEAAQDKKYQLKKHYGIISYNDTPLKKIVEKGITTITTNFNTMGETMAKMILQQQNIQVHNPCDIIVRKSL